MKIRLIHTNKDKFQVLKELPEHIKEVLWNNDHDTVDIYIEEKEQTKTDDVS